MGNADATAARVARVAAVNFILMCLVFLTLSVGDADGLIVWSLFVLDCYQSCCDDGVLS